MSIVADQRPGARVRRHLSELVRLATPVTISRAGILLLATTDIAMLGRLDSYELARYTLGTSPFVILMVIGIGLLFGTSVATSHAHGEGDHRQAGAVWRHSLPHAVLIGLLFMGLCQLGESYFTATRQAPDMISGASSVSAYLGLGLLPTMLFITCSFFLEALRRPMPVLISIGIANLVNIGLNAVLIFGGLGLPAMGADGAAIATAIARTAMAIFLFGYIWFLRDHQLFGLRDRQTESWIRGGRQQRAYGYAAGLSFGFETLSFGVMNIFAGWLGEGPLAIFGVVMNLMSVLFMIALGIAAATSVRVGIAHGRKDLPDRALAGWTGFAVTLAIMAVFFVVLRLWPDWIAALYLPDEALIALSLSSFILLGVIMFGDGGQILLAQSLRGAADTWVPTAMSFCSYIVIQIPCGWYFAFHLDHGVYGLFEGILVGSLISISVLLCRWVWICRRG